MWYNLNDILQYNCVYSFVVGMRGGGKTFAFKERAIKNFLKDGSQFIYLRRYKTELKKVRNFFEPDLVEKFPGNVFGVKGNTFYINNQVAGYAIALTCTMQEKQNNYAKVTLVGFDEFILDSSGSQKYLPNEFDTFNNFYDTVDRNKDKTRVLFIGNAISEVNPYFSGLSICPDQNKRFTKYIKGGEVLAVIEVWSDENIKAQRKQTRFGKLMAGTEYDAFSNDNKFYRDNTSFIKQRPDNAVYLFGIFSNGQILGVWQDRLYLDTFISSDFRKRDLYCCLPSDQRDRTDFGCEVKLTDLKASSMGRRLVRASWNQYLYFEQQEIKNSFMGITKYLPF